MCVYEAIFAGDLVDGQTMGRCISVRRHAGSMLPLVRHLLEHGAALEQVHGGK
jgi:hypothetical protein